MIRSGMSRLFATSAVVAVLTTLVPATAAQAVGATTNGRIAFGHRFPSGNIEIVTVLPDGTGMKRLTERPASDTSPSYSANGAYITFASDASGSWQVWEMWTNGSHKKPVTHMKVSATSPDLGQQGHGHSVVFAGDAGLGTGDDLLPDQLRRVPPDADYAWSGGRRVPRVVAQRPTDRVRE